MEPVGQGANARNPVVQVMRLVKFAKARMNSIESSQLASTSSSVVFKNIYAENYETGLHSTQTNKRRNNTRHIWIEV